MVIHETLYEHCEKMNQGSACMKERHDNHRTHTLQKKMEKQEEALKPFTLIHESFLIIN
jgi:hypothetical protein